ncbi:MAG TPA: helix-turn-helix transcriptional regulator [Gammaproteobacteria bacterium]|jgi:transcriptional regulator with XRE-family HTH domain|nr:helix-turn-helix transcriptional regulator [Gammaproteobacteria bacterium]
MAKRSTKWHETLEKAVFSDDESKAAYEAFRLQYELSKHLKSLREKAHLTQEQVAERMDTHKPIISRLESISGSAKHMPSLLTLIKYADAVGYQLKILFVPDKRSHKKRRVLRKVGEKE